MKLLVDAYDAGVASATGGDIRIRSTTTRVSDFVNRGTEFDDVYVFPPLLEACCRIIGRPFKLSSMHARTLRTGMPAQELHVDVRRNSADWPLVGFILMVDEFRPRQRLDALPARLSPMVGHPGGHLVGSGGRTRWTSPGDRSAGSLLVFNGSAWHGHTANTSTGPRRSLQGAFIPRDGRAGTDFAARMRPETRRRLGPLARYVLAL